MEHVGIFHGNLKYFMVTWNILWPFGIFYGDLWSCGTFPLFWYIAPRKIWQP
jgi:hypothetical protein